MNKTSEIARCARLRSTPVPFQDLSLRRGNGYSALHLSWLTRVQRWGPFDSVVFSSLFSYTSFFHDTLFSTCLLVQLSTFSYCRTPQDPQDRLPIDGRFISSDFGEVFAGLLSRFLSTAAGVDIGLHPHTPVLVGSLRILGRGLDIPEKADTVTTKNVVDDRVSGG
jgi:hypothetical protein